MAAERQLDLITIGRSCIDLYGEQIGGRLEDMTSFAKYIGGSPTNPAVGASRLGLRSGLLTRVGADHFGRFIREQLAREPRPLPRLIINPERKRLEDFVFEDFSFEGYDPHPHIKADVSV